MNIKPLDKKLYFILVVLAVIFPFLISSLPISCLCIKYGDRKNHIYRAVVPGDYKPGHQGGTI